MTRKVRMKCFWAQEAEMSIITVNMFQTGKSKTCMMSRNFELSVFSSKGRNEPNSC